MRILRKTAAIFIALVGLLCVLYIGAWFLVQTRQFQSWLEASAGDAGIDLRVAGLAPVFNTLLLPLKLIAPPLLAAIRMPVPAGLFWSRFPLRVTIPPVIFWIWTTRPPVFLVTLPL